MQTEYTRNYSSPLAFKNRRLPKLNNRRTIGGGLSLSPPKPFSGSNSLMDDWLTRTKPQDPAEDTFERKTHLHTFSNTDRPRTMSRAAKILQLSENYQARYQELMNNLNERQASGPLPTHLISGGKGRWRHIQENYGYGSNLMAWIDGTVVNESQNERSNAGVFGVQTPSGKGPNKHVNESHGAGASNIAWIGDGRKETPGCHVPLPTVYQHEHGPYSVRLQVATPRKKTRDSWELSKP